MNTALLTAPQSTAAKCAQPGAAILAPTPADTCTNMYPVYAPAVRSGFRDKLQGEVWCGDKPSAVWWCGGVAVIYWCGGDVLEC